MSFVNRLRFGLFPMTSKKSLSERDICTKYILPAIIKAGWDSERQIREEVFFTKGRIFVKGRQTARGGGGFLRRIG